MKFIRALCHYPLLARELTERANRPMTYRLRVVYGLVIYAVFGFMLMQAPHLTQEHGWDGAVPIGHGYVLLATLVHLLTWSLLLIQPALAAGVVTYERERASFDLLLLTRLGPTKILLEKYFAGLLPMATLLLLALPLGAITMGYGGVSVQLLLATVVLLLSTWLCVGAWAILCSAWARTTTGAILFCYIGGLCILLLPALAYTTLQRDVLFTDDLSGVNLPQWVWALSPTQIFNHILGYQQSTFQQGAEWTTRYRLVIEAVHRCTPLFALAVLFLALARRVLLREVKPRFAVQPGPRKEGLATRFWRRFRPTKEDLPSDDPVSWRESGRSVFGRRGRFFRSTIFLCAGTLTLVVFLLGLHPLTQGPDRLQRLANLVAFCGFFMMVVRSINALLDEQSNQTLDILLTTPMGAHEVLRGKAKAVSRYWLLFGSMLAIIFVAQGWSEFEARRSGHFWQPLAQFWSTQLLAVIVYPPLVIWTSLLIATVARRRNRAVFVALLVFAVWTAGPLVGLQHYRPEWREKSACLWTSLLSPLGIIDANLHDRLGYFSMREITVGRVHSVAGAPWVPVAVNYALYLAWLSVVRSLCLYLGERCLRK